MALFNHKIGIADIIREITDADFTSLSQDTNVDYCTKVLKGKLFFYLLLYGMLKVDRLSQRGLKDVFESNSFRVLFNITCKKTISHSSISDRLATIDIAFFSRAYEVIHERLSNLYSDKEIEGMLLQRVDSTLVAEAGNKLGEGMSCGNEHKKKKMLKFTFNFNGMFASFSQVHSEEKYANESLALPENVLGHFKKEKNHAMVYVFDRGLSSGQKFVEFKQEQGLHFVGRLADNRKSKFIRDAGVENKEFTFGDLIQDDIVNIYGSEKYKTKTGKVQNKQILLKDEFRVVRFRPSKNEKDILLITNIFDLPAQEIAQMYKQRWDIEVFFRFLKQELNFSHFLSLNQNGIQVIMYMTLITAMLVMIYKKENKIGFKTAVRRAGIELENIIVAITVVHCGGDIRKADLPYP